MSGKYDDLGFEEDVGFVEDTPVDKPAEQSSDVPNEFEINRMALKDVEVKKSKEAALQKFQQEAADRDPRNWTLKRTQDHFKDNPPKTPQEEVQAKILIDAKKDALKEAAGAEIRQAQPKSLMESIGQVLSKPFVQTPEEKQAKAQNVMAIAHVYDLPANEVERNYDALAKTIFHRDPTGMEIVKTMAIAPIVAGLISHPVATGLTLTAFGALSEVENAAVSKIKSEPFQFLRGRTVKDLLPAEANAGTKEAVDLLEFIGLGFASAGVTKGATPILERFTKDFFNSHKLPKELYHATASGEDVKIPIEKVPVLAQGKNWDSVKDELSVAPTPPEVVKAKKEAFENAVAEKEVGFVQDEVQAPKTPTEATGAQKKATPEPIPTLPDEIVKMPDVVAAREAAKQIQETHTIDTPERQALRQQVAEEAYGEGAPVKERRADIVLGGPAAGKGQVVNPLLKKHGSMLIDSDVYKEKFPEYNNGVGAAAVHKESSDIIEAQVLRRAVTNGDNIVIPRLGKNPKAIEKIINVLNERGYNVHLHNVKLPVEKAMGRSVSRFRETGRFVDPEYVQKVGLTPQVSYDTFKSSKGVKGYAEYSTDVEKGSQPLVLEDNGAAAFGERGLQRTVPAQGAGDVGARSVSQGDRPQDPPADQANLKEPPEGLARRKFISTVRDAEKTAPEVAREVESIYQPISNEQTLAEAKAVLASDPNGAQIMVEGPGRPTRVSNAVAQLLIDKAQNEGRFVDAIRLVERTAEKNTELGQTIQALSMYKRLTPEGILRFAQKQLEVAGVKIDPKFGEALVERARKMKEMPEGRDKDIETALILKDIAKKIPSNMLQKISMVQTMAQLLNPKTMVRNLLGNLGLVITENIAGSIGTALDIAVSSRTGRRTQYLPDLVTQAKGMAQGAREGTQEALLGIDLKPTKNKFDLPRNSVFDEGVMGGLEKALSISLGAADRAFYQAAFNDSLRMQVRAAKVSEPTGEMIERAHYEGLYRTFQDENAISRLFVGLKKALNVGKDWGLGDMVLKYPKTPANLLARGIEYSPFGFAQSIMKISEPLFGKPFDQAGFVKSTSRALTGSSLLVGTGAILARMGIITGKREKDSDIAATQQNVGIRDYQINVDALKRFVSSGMDADQAKMKKGDLLVTYDWMQPASIGLALGANMVLSKDNSATDKVINLADRIFEASETLASQPLVQGLKKITGYGSISEGVASTLQGIPASFVPTILNQVRQLMDNTARNTRDPNYYKEIFNQVIGKVPGVSGQLPARVNSLGKPQEMYQGGTNNPFNVFLNPTFASRYNPDKVSEMVLGIWERSGQSVQFPRMSGSKIKVGAEQIEMSPEQYGEFQAYIGEKTNKLFGILADNEKFMGLPDDKKAKLLQGYLTDINTGAKIEVLGYRPKRASQDMIDIMKMIGREHKEVKKNEADTEDVGFTEDVQ